MYLRFLWLQEAVCCPTVTQHLLSIYPTPLPGIPIFSQSPCLASLEPPKGINCSTILLSLATFSCSFLPGHPYSVQSLLSATFVLVLSLIFICVLRLATKSAEEAPGSRGYGVFCLTLRSSKCWKETSPETHNDMDHQSSCPHFMPETADA